MAAKDLIQLDGEPLDLVLLVFSCGIWRSMTSGGMRWLQKSFTVQLVLEPHRILEAGES